MRRMLAAGMLIGLLTPASPQLLTSPKAIEEPSAADKAHLEWLARAWSQTPDNDKAKWTRFADTGAPTGSAKADQAGQAHWDWLGSMWARARESVQPGAARRDLLRVFRSNGYGPSAGSVRITEQYVMRRCPFIIVTVLEDAGRKELLNGGPPDNSARIEKIVRQELWPYLPVQPDAVDTRNCRLLDQEWSLASGVVRTELERRAGEWGNADSARREALARLAGMAPDEKLRWDWLGQRWDEAKSIRPGISEADLNVVFQRDGGFGLIPPRRWVLRRCDCIKIDVQFEMNPRQENLSHAFELPSYELKTTKISEPRIEQMRSD